jgi:serine/threonine protein kinase
LGFDAWKKRSKCFSATMNGEKVALIFKINTTNAKEIDFLHRLNHPHIVHMFAGWSNFHFYAVVEEYLGLPTDFSWNHISSMIEHMLKALKYLEEQLIVHRDVKPQNILFDRKNWCWKLLDFDLATQLLAKNNFLSFTEGVGTTGFIAPEVETVTEGYNYKADVWSLGKSVQTTIQSLKKNPCHKKAGEIEKFINRSLTVDPSCRPTASQLLFDCLVKATAQKFF